ncbi:alpha/beta fold hydrolase [Hoyosella subflava]|uniref:Alpha/beta hydrolase fold protein n=1 Tax=Hoyosella subflava (strain DSM 45089 / JCM 17490 / NBRC 109087 / DQS3-9A1) TaxID=443218 RepID=F6ERX5_HOYSD|nr:alpha/beta hydrolase [Hoyosella subflava]AEF40790.1 Alpha/beta hydrolase fold protein [Hoyosella subflava DQS3-9A1]
MNWSQATTPDGQTFVYDDRGSGPLIVLWHGYPDTPNGWTSTAEALAAAGYRVITPWLRGYHPATVQQGRDYRPRTLAQETSRLLDALGEEDAIVVGHDFGALLTYGAAAYTPERVRAIVTVAIPHVSLMKPSLGLAWSARHFAELRLPWARQWVQRKDFKYISDEYRRWAPNWNGESRDRTLADTKKCFAEPGNLDGALAYYRQFNGQFGRIGHTIDKRGLAVGGTADLIPAEAVEATPSRLREGSTALIIEGAGHWPHRENESQFQGALLEFLASLE